MQESLKQTNIFSYRQFSLSGSQRFWGRGILWFAVYMGVGLLVNQSIPLIGVSLWYPPIALAMAILLIEGKRYWFVVLTADVLVSYLRFKHGWLVAVLLAANTLFEAALGVLLLHWFGFHPRLRRIQDMLLLSLLAAVLATSIGAASGSLLLVQLGAAPSFKALWQSLWMMDVASVVSLLPAFLLWGMKDEETVFRRRLLHLDGRTLELAMIATLTVGVGWRLFSYAVFIRNDAIASHRMFLFLPVLWLAIRFSLKTTTSLIVFINVVANFFFLSADSVAQNSAAQIATYIYSAQIFLMILAVGSIILAIAIQNERAAAQSLQSSARQLSELAAIVETSAAAIISKTPEGIISSWNVGAQKIYGYTADEVIGKPVTLLIPPDCLDEYESLTEQIQGGEKVDYLETYRLRKDGKRIFVSLTNSLMKDGEGRVIGVSMIAHDISEQKQIQDERDRFFNTSIDMLCLADFDGYFKRLNPAWQQTFGLTNDELQSQPLLEYVHPDDRASTWAEILTVRSSGTNVSFENRFRCRDGSYRWLLWSITASPADWLLYAIAKDITNRKQTEALLCETTAQITDIVNSISDAFIVLNRQWELTYVNPQAERYLRRSRQQVLGKNVWQEFPRFLDSIFYEQAHKALSENVSVAFEGYDAWLNIWWDVHIYPGKDGVSIYYRDITERKNSEEILKKTEEQLRQSQKMDAVGKLAGGIAHDFNNLLTAILGYSQLSMRNVEPSAPLYHHLLEIHRAGERAASLTQQLLAFSRKQHIQPRTLDLNQVIGDSLKMLRRLIGEDIEVNANFDPLLGSVKADPHQIEQVIINLAINARDAMPKGGQLHLETRNIFLNKEAAQQYLEVHPGHYILVTVSDNGTGMDDETLQHIFEPFFTTKAAGKGTGLGLSTVYGIVKQSGGQIWCDSTLDQGTTFKLLFPRIRDEKKKLDAGEIESEIPRGNETILISEDDALIRKLTTQVLSDCGYTVIVADCGLQAMEIAQARRDTRIHLLITDVVMPGISGREVANLLAPLRPEMKVLYISGYTEDAISRHGALEPGIVLLNKPFTPSALLKKVRDVLDGK
ncbi:MAG: PAS domain S-box protein [Acidobacteria bacterium]|nr:PAS domain S-box protein [Acidobacteriota bacterium]